MEINVNGLNKLNDSINRDIKDFESYVYDLLSTVKNMSFYWHDGYTTSFFNQINGLQEDVNELVNSLYSILNLLRAIYSYYNNINYIKGDIGRFGIVDDDDFYEKPYDDEITLKKKKSIRNKIIYAEDDISYGIGRIFVFLVRSVSFNNLELNKDSSDLLGMQENMNDELNKFKTKIESFTIHSEGLVNDLYSVQKVYESVNMRKILTKIDSISNSMNILNVNFRNAIDYIHSRKKEYASMFEDMALEVLNEVE